MACEVIMCKSEVGEGWRRLRRDGLTCLSMIKYSRAESVRSMSVVSLVPSSLSSDTHSWCWKETLAPCCRRRMRQRSFVRCVAR